MLFSFMSLLLCTPLLYSLFLLDFLYPHVVSIRCCKHVLPLQTECGTTSRYKTSNLQWILWEYIHIILLLQCFVYTHSCFIHQSVIPGTVLMAGESLYRGLYSASSQRGLPLRFKVCSFLKRLRYTSCQSHTKVQRHWIFQSTMKLESHQSQPELEVCWQEAWLDYYGTDCCILVPRLTFSKSFKSLFPTEKTCSSVNASMFSIFCMRLLYSVRSSSLVRFSSPSITSMLLKDRSTRVQYISSGKCRHFWQSSKGS